MKKRWKRVLAGTLAVAMVLTSYAFDWSSATKAEAAGEASENVVAGDVLADVDFTKTDLTALDQQFIASQGTSDTDRKTAANVSEYWIKGEKATVNAALEGTAVMTTMSGYTAATLIDGDTTKAFTTTNYHDTADIKENSEKATVTFAGNAYYEINKVQIYWRGKAGCPENFEIQVFNGNEWETKVKVEEPNYSSNIWSKDIEPTRCNAIRLVATKLRPDTTGKYCLQLSEFEAWGEKVEYLKTKTTYNSKNPTETLLTLNNANVKNFKAEIEMVYFNSNVTRYGLYFGQSEADKVSGASLIQPYLGTLKAYGGLYANGVQSGTPKYVNENEAMTVLDSTNDSGIKLFNIGNSYAYNKVSIKDFPRDFNEGNIQTLNVEVIDSVLTLWWTGFEKAAWTVELTDYQGGYISLMSRGNDQGGIKSFKVQEYRYRQENVTDFAEADLTALDEQFIASQGTSDTDRRTAANVSEYWFKGEKAPVNAALEGTAEMEIMPYLEAQNHTAAMLNDGKTSYTSTDYATVAETTKEATITFAGNAYYEINKVQIYWRGKAGCPENFEIQVFNGNEWETKVKVEEPNYSSNIWSKDIEPTRCNAIRLVATKLRPDTTGKYCLQLSEFEAWGEKVEYLKTKTTYNSKNPTETLLTLNNANVKNFKAEIEMVYFNSNVTRYGLYFGQSEADKVNGASLIQPFLGLNTAYGGLYANGVKPSTAEYKEEDLQNYLDNPQNLTGVNLFQSGGAYAYNKVSVRDFPQDFNEGNIQTLNVEVIDSVLKLWWTGFENAAWTVELTDYEGGYISLMSRGNNQGGIKSFRFYEIVDSELQSNVDMNVEPLGDYTIVSVTNDIAGGILKDSTFNGNVKYDTTKFEYCTTVITDSRADIHENVVAAEGGGNVNVSFSSYHAGAAAKLYFKNKTNELDYNNFGVKVDSIIKGNGKSVKSTTTETVAYDYTGAEGTPDKLVDARDLVRAAKENKAPSEMRSALVGVGSDWVAGIIGEVKDTVYVDAVKGSDTGAGTQNSPLNSMTLAAYQVADHGTIQVVGDYKFGSAEKTIGMGQKTITITGGTLDLTGINTLDFNGAVTFDNVDMKVGNKTLTVFANGHNLTVNSGVTFEGAIAELYGGNAGEISLASTNINLQAGNYYIIYGGSRGASTITGDTNVTIGGTVNSGAQYLQTVNSQTQKNVNFEVSEHIFNEIVCVYGGSRNGLVKGNTIVTVEESAQTSMVNGGGWGGSSEVKGTCNVYVKGGKTFGYYGGSLGGIVYDTNILMTGGETIQIWGGCWTTSKVGNVNGGMTGNTKVTFIGGTVTRRIFGGCYNNSSSDGHIVIGNSVLNIGGDANFSHSIGLDNVICAGSRYSTGSDTEKSVLNITTDRQNAFGTYINDSYGSSDTVNVVNELP